MPRSSKQSKEEILIKERSPRQDKKEDNGLLWPYHNAHGPTEENLDVYKEAHTETFELDYLFNLWVRRRRREKWSEAF